MIKNIGIIGGTGNMGSCFKNAFDSLDLNVQVSDINSKDKEDILIETSGSAKIFSRARPSFFLSLLYSN